MIKKSCFWLTVAVSLFILNNNVWADDYVYQGKVEGLVCAFCAYNVSKSISQIQGVYAYSINIELESGMVDFLSSTPVEYVNVSKIFVDSGFTLIELTQVTDSDVKQVSFLSEPLLSVEFSSNEIEHVDVILDVIGSLAIAQTSKLVIKAPKSVEIDILKPILAGRKNVIRVKFTPIEKNIVELKLYQAVILTDKLK